MFPVLFQILREHEDVVQICHTEDVKVFAQDFVHPSLERGWGIGQSKRHDIVFV